MCSGPVMQAKGGGAQGACPSQNSQSSQFFAINVHINFFLIKCTTFVLTRPTSRPQQWACVHVYADAVLPVQYTDSPRPVVD